MGESPEKSPNLAKLSNWLAFSVEASRNKHWEWFVIDQFLRGNHNIRGNPSNNTIIVGKRQEAINFPINKLYSTFRSVRAFVARHKPKVEVSPKDSSDEAKDYARRSNKLLARDNELNDFNHINKEWVYYGIKYGRGWRQIGYDKEKQVAIRWSVDPFDVLLGSKTGKWEDSPYLIKNVKRTVGYWKDKYPKKDVSADNKTHFDEYKQLMDEVNTNHQGENQQSRDEQTMIAHECWYKLFKPNSLGGLINKVLFTENDVLQFEETPYTEYPFITYDAEILPNELYPDGHLKHIIPAQRMLNLLNTQLLEYNHIVNRGRFIKDKNAGFRAIYAKEGQIIEKNRQASLQVLPPPPINPALERQITMAESWIEDIGGQHDASLGATPERVSSGRAIETLQLGDSNNISDLRDNFEIALQKEAAWILKMYSLFERDGFVLEEETKTGEEPDKFGVVGTLASGGNIPEKYYIEENGSYCDICAILPDNQVKVSVTSELGETKSARMNLLLELVSMGLPFKILLEYLEFPNTQDILERIADEAVADSVLGQLGQQPNGQPAPPGSDVPPPPSPELEAVINEVEG
jgi:hypothetical protein